MRSDMEPDPHSPIPKRHAHTHKKKVYGLSALLAVVGALLYVYGHPEAAGALLTISGIGVSLPSLQRNKAAKVLLFAVAWSLCGCAAKGTVDAQTALDLFKPIRQRHDVLVVLDNTLSDEKKTTALRSTELLELYFNTAIESAQPNTARVKGD